MDDLWAYIFGFLKFKQIQIIKRVSKCFLKNSAKNIACQEIKFDAHLNACINKGFVATKNLGHYKILKIADITELNVYSAIKKTVSKCLTHIHLQERNINLKEKKLALYER